MDEHLRELERNVKLRRDAPEKNLRTMLGMSR